ncbi:1-deoxy-D-xylulose-5-phosphate synthase [Lacrimispora algidixylanolytica]|uniref:1-deoxy-D-xylulose-5-phosphate synthase n=1 Tax=Lacrimispora algidixylanolytica TaxID=94868 RepID=A0A419T4Q8_9FIRM|nr:1-deoxy-D-xylulose-5-phosphate synthase [Lacrimispora algidixylanolytica]RKD32368.1 1-deoxy-D-xylulose-5-phosphate synthase [Lacrimispora algidixylanolytica]
MSKILDKYNDIEEIKEMSIDQLNLFCQEIREFIVMKIFKTGGHLASNLGIVELTISLYNIFDFRKDKLIWDVGHQTYVHKILTGRASDFDTLRQYQGLSGFPKREESNFDIFETGHSSTSLSAALGIARARNLNGEVYDVIAVIGDGALTGGMAFEALNDIGGGTAKVIIILNDNQMSISENVGGISSYLYKIRLAPKYIKIKGGIKTTLKKFTLGKTLAKALKKLKSGIKEIMIPNMLFEDMGIKYMGPINGHDIKEMSKVFKMARDSEESVLIHVITTKGKGVEFAEKNPEKFHAIGPFDCKTGEMNSITATTYSEAFGEEAISLAKADKRLVAITAAMKYGTGLNKFSLEFKDRFFDVGIAEQHAVTMAAGMASNGLKPIFAVYSTFIQRAYDQILHDVCLQKLPVIFAIDRAGLVGEDGKTHQGIFDVSFLSHIPNLIIINPKNILELKNMLRWSFFQNEPIAIRYPKGSDDASIELPPIITIKKGKWQILSNEGNIVIFATGKMVQRAIQVRNKLLDIGINISIVNACFIKPIDEELINYFVNKEYDIITLEDNILHGGFGAMVLEYINSLDKNTKILTLGFNDSFIEQGNVDILYKLYELDVDGIIHNIIKFSHKVSLEGEKISKSDLL